jgi:hypothetical protein
MKSGTHVEVRTKFDGNWAAGFVLEHEEVDAETLRPAWRTVRRASDGMVIPERFSPADVRRVRHRGRSTWWY